MLIFYCNHSSQADFEPKRSVCNEVCRVVQKETSENAAVLFGINFWKIISTNSCRLLDMLSAQTILNHAHSLVLNGLCDDQCIIVLNFVVIFYVL